VTRARWLLLAAPVLVAGYFALRMATTYDYLVGPPKPESTRSTS
jgi:hypothetical protein